MLIIFYWVGRKGIHHHLWVMLLLFLFLFVIDLEENKIKKYSELKLTLFKNITLCFQLLTNNIMFCRKNLEDWELNNSSKSFIWWALDKLFEMEACDKRCKFWSIYDCLKHEEKLHIERPMLAVPMISPCLSKRAHEEPEVCST